jgi:hypothetical protein
MCTKVLDDLAYLLHIVLTTEEHNIVSDDGNDILQAKRTEQAR